MATKTWKVRYDSPTGIQIGDNHITANVATQNDTNGIHIDETGTYIRGNLSIMTTPENIRIGGLWVQPTAWQQMFPSSLAFPNPNLILAPSMKGIEYIAKTTAWAMSFLV